MRTIILHLEDVYYGTKDKLSVFLFNLKQFVFCKTGHKWNDKKIIFFKDEEGNFKDENYFCVKSCKSCGVYSFKHNDLDNKWSV